MTLPTIDLRKPTVQKQHETLVTLMRDIKKAVESVWGPIIQRSEEGEIHQVSNVAFEVYRILLTKMAPQGLSIEISGEVEEKKGA